MSKVHLASPVEGPAPAREVVGPRGRCTEWTRRIIGVAPLLAMIISLAALGTALLQLVHARRAARDGAIADVMRQSSQILMAAADDPETYAYFERDLFGPSDGHRTLDELARADRGTRMRVQILCETLADFFESTYDRREQFDGADWSAWWSYMADVYAESPVLRDYLRRRHAWYDLDEALAATARGISTVGHARATARR